MWDLVHHPMRSEEFFAVFVLVCAVGGIATALTKVVLRHLRRSQLDEMEMVLKMEMIQRGMSAGEITQVLAAKTNGAHADKLRDIAVSAARTGADWIGLLKKKIAPERS